MVDQKFVFVTFIVLIVGSCVNSLPHPSSSTEPPTSSAPSSNSTVTPPALGNVITVPTNCPPGEEFIGGACREVWSSV